MKDLEKTFCDLMDLFAKEENNNPEILLSKVRRVVDEGSQFFKFRVGNIFNRDGENFILANIGDGKVALISIKDGNRWHDPCHVINPFSISYYEFCKICDKSQKEFVLIKSVSI